ncbi:protein BREAST CANCER SUSCEPTIBILITY 1 homolog [Coffea eugenioides]|uniref:protein BREAST CANCER SUSCEPTIBILITY 1 homolog n=1 Tax=Coffea eugenioides TaxID=49369 RepID=UPI000F60DC9D|nr:protein BREAST CANCER SUSCEPTIBILITY 1 homolog [Coffea eugenioides]
MAADTSHLEKMGRELKCPICLSLLNSAVSLSCNHVFCNCCIEKSMKSASDCPVCKVPFRRREIRPAPHMDNLVSIYKSMEVASGVNIFVTQTAPTTRLSGHESHSDGDKIGDIQENINTCIGTSAEENQKICKRKGSKRSTQAKCPLKPSFPKKKRVHVPQSPPSETPIRLEKLVNETAEISKNEPESSFLMKEKHVFKKKGEPLFTPFFWLRDEEDPENPTQQTDEDQIMDTPPDAPCFSDIKDSDDEVPNEMPPDGEKCIACSDMDLFDSEMFEWTQRGCSPELQSSPVPMQAEECGEDIIEPATHITTTIVDSKVQNREVRISETDKEDLGLPCLSVEIPMDKIASKAAGMSRKRIKKSVENSQSKRAKMTTNKARTAHKESEQRPGKSMPEEQFGNNDNVFNLPRKTSKRNKKVSFDANVAEAAGNTSTSSGGTNPLFKGKNKVMIGLPDLLGHKRQKRGSKREKIGKMKDSLKLEKHSPNLRAKKPEELDERLTLKQCGGLISHSGQKVAPEEEGAFGMDRVLRRCGDNHGKKKKNLKMARCFKGNKSGNTLTDLYQNGDGEVAAEIIPSVGADQEKPTSRETQNPAGVHPQGASSPNKIQCAFCQSAEDSEASGVMVHYLKGKPISGDEIRGPNVIHSHKYCTEWAPNVFFQDDNAINLEAELARSRKIKCGLCGMRGAALGCFQKSCRKSFHVTCAKLTPNFRWDYDNFVALCPLHASCKMPCEATGSESNTKRKSAPKGDYHIQGPQVVKDDVKEHLQWKCDKKAKNLILCCSGLTNAEKDIVSQFQQLSGVIALKNWDLSVTHIVASTDENGVCKRTLKFMMGVLEGKWIVNIEWVKACIKLMELVDEELYEIKVDSHGIRDGPSRGRSRLLDKKPKLFSGYKFYFLGEFVPSYKGYLHDLVIAAGGTVLNRKPISEEQKIFSSECPPSTTFIVYSLEQPEKCGASKRNTILNRRRFDAEALASSTRAVAVSNSWILNSIAGCKLQNLPE